MSAMPKYALTYVAVWADAFGPGRHLLKVGRAWRFSRVQMMVTSGARIVVLARGTDATWEREALRILRRWFPAAFTREDDARDFLFMGRGWTECFEVDDHHLQLAVDMCFEGFARGSDQGVNEATDDQRDGSGFPRVSQGAARGEADSDRVVDEVDGRVGSEVVRPGADRGGAVSGAGRDGDGRGAPADAGRVGVPVPVPGGRGGLATALEAPEGGQAGSGGRLPSTPTGSSTDVHGCGGSEGAGRVESAGGGCRAGGRVVRVGGGAGTHPNTGQTSAAGRSTYRLPGTPGRKVRELWTLRHRPPPARQVGGSGEIHPGARRQWRAGRRRGAVVTCASR